MSPVFDPTSLLDDDLPGEVVRRAAASDVEAIHALWRRAHGTERRFSRDQIAELVQRGWFLLVERAGEGLIGAVHVRLQGRIGRVTHLTMDPRHRRHRLATRLLGVADALCAVFGCTPYEEMEIDVAA
jgi:N-acetylglutamate synthase-like GNAT family acetyltransferase